MNLVGFLNVFGLPSCTRIRHTYNFTSEINSRTEFCVSEQNRDAIPRL